jgi:RNA polymerase sigma factor (sigma-70 family)
VLRLLDFTRRAEVRAPVPAPPALPDADDVALVGRLALDDAQALGQLLDRYWGPTLRPQASPRAYLYRVLRNLIIDEYRRRRLRDRFAQLVGGSEVSDAPSPVAVLEADELAGAAQRAIAALPERRRDVFVLAHLHGLSYKEVAETLGITPRTVANHMSLALAQLRDALRGYTGERGVGTRVLPFPPARRAPAAAGDPAGDAPAGPGGTDPPLGAPSS